MHAFWVLSSSRKNALSLITRMTISLTVLYPKGGKYLTYHLSLLCIMFDTLKNIFQYYVIRCVISAIPILSLGI